MVHHPQGYIKNVQAANNESVWLHGAGTTEQAQTITSDQNIASHQNITYTAAQTITLKPDFHAKAGSDFLAHIAPINTAPQYEWQYTLSDHLGNTRVLFADKNNDGQINSETEILQQLDYFAFGMEKQWASVATDPTRYTYNGKELDGFSGLQFYGARNYDGTTGRFTGVDPLADHPNQVDKSPYAYAWNNPVLLTDPDGRCPKCWVSAFRVGKKAYKIYKKTGKLTPKSLKKAGLDEVVDIAGDLQTIFSGDAGWLDRVGAAADLIVGTDFNSKGNKTVSKSLGLADDANDARKAGKAKNKLEPDGDATGDHTVFKRDDNGDIYKYETYEKTRTGHDNPTKRFDGGKPDGSPGAPHTNKQTKEKVPTPHVQGNKIPGGVRPAQPDEIPNNKRFNNYGG